MWGKILFWLLSKIVSMTLNWVMDYFHKKGVFKKKKKVNRERMKEITNTDPNRSLKDAREIARRAANFNG